MTNAFSLSSPSPPPLSHRSSLHFFPKLFPARRRGRATELPPTSNTIFIFSQAQNVLTSDSGAERGERVAGAPPASPGSPGAGGEEADRVVVRAVSLGDRQNRCVPLPPPTLTQRHSNAASGCEIDVVENKVRKKKKKKKKEF